MKLRPQQRGLGGVSTSLFAKNQRLGGGKKKQPDQKNQSRGGKYFKKTNHQWIQLQRFSAFLLVFVFYAGWFLFQLRKKYAAVKIGSFFIFPEEEKIQEICWNHLTYIAWYFLLGREWFGVFGEFVLLRFKVFLAAVIHPAVQREVWKTQKKWVGTCTKCSWNLFHVFQSPLQTNGSGKESLHKISFPHRVVFQWPLITAKSKTHLGKIWTGSNMNKQHP